MKKVFLKVTSLLGLVVMLFVVQGCGQKVALKPASERAHDTSAY